MCRVECREDIVELHFSQRDSTKSCPQAFTQSRHREQARTAGALLVIPIPSYICICSTYI